MACNVIQHGPSNFLHHQLRYHLCQHLDRYQIDPPRLGSMAVDLLEGEHELVPEEQEFCFRIMARIQGFQRPLKPRLLKASNLHVRTALGTKDMSLSGSVFRPEEFSIFERYSEFL